MTHQEKVTRWDSILQVLTDSRSDEPGSGENGFLTVLSVLVNEAMKVERSAALGAGPYERNAERKGYANGFKPKAFASRLGKLDLQVPQVRGDVDFYPSALERGVRSERALKFAIAEMYVQGVSTRKVTQVMEQLCGLEVSSTQVSRCSALLDAELQQWRERPLGEFLYLILDARYEKMRHAGAVISCAVLSAIGIDAAGKRTVLGISVSLSEAEVHWRDFLSSLQERGLFGVKMIVSDSHAGLKAACTARFAGAPWQRCQFHLAQNALHQVSRQSQKPEVARELQAIFNAGDIAEANVRLAAMVSRHENDMPKLAAWLEANVPESLTVFALPEAHRKRLRTTNMLERLHKEVKRRTRVATLFPNEASLLRLITAVMAEVSDEWECAKRYLPHT